MIRRIKLKKDCWINVKALDNGSNALKGIVSTRTRYRQGHTLNKVLGICIPFLTHNGGISLDGGNAYFYGTESALTKNFRNRKNFDDHLGIYLSEFTDDPLPDTIAKRQEEKETTYKIPLSLLRDKLFSHSQRAISDELVSILEERLPLELEDLSMIDLERENPESKINFLKYLHEFPHKFRAEALKKGRLYYNSSNRLKIKEIAMILPSPKGLIYTPMGGQPKR